MWRLREWLDRHAVRGVLVWIGPRAIKKQLRGRDGNPAHRRRDELVRGHPRIARLRGAQCTKPLVQHPQQRLTNRGVMLRAYAVAHVPLAERREHRLELVGPVRALDDEAQRIHQLSPLNAWLGVEERAERRIELEEPRVEELRGFFSHRCDELPGAPQ